ncbi:MAG: trigger factor [Rhodospirillales bacterium]
MQVTEISNEGLKRQYKILVPASDISQQVDRRLGEIGKDARIAGFRPGKAPLALLKKQYGQALMGEILEKTVNDSSQKTIADRGLRPASQPKVEIVKFGEGEDLEFSMDFEILPEIAPMDFSGIEIERLRVEITSDMVQETMQRVADQQRQRKPAPDGKSAEKGDVIVIDFLGKIDGTSFENGSAENYELELGSNSFIPGFEDQLVGAKVGEQREVTVDFPADYGAADLAGKTAVFDCTVKQVMISEPRSIDDQLAKATGFDNLEAMSSAVRQRMEIEYNGMSRMRMKRQLLDKLATDADFAVPDSLVEAEFNSIWQRVEEARKQGEKVIDDDEDKARKEYRDIALRRVRLGLLLAEIGRQNNIQVTPEEMNRAMAAEAQRYPGQEKQVIEFFQNNAQARDSLRAPLFEDKTVDFIFELAKVSERTTTREELAKDPDEDAEGDKASGEKTDKA